MDIQHKVIDKITSAICKHRNTKQCAAICLSYSSSIPIGECPERITVWGEAALAAIEVLSTWKPINTAPWSKLILVRGPSGYITYGQFIISAYRDGTSYRRDSWLDPTNTRLSNNGWYPSEWMEIPE